MPVLRLPLIPDGLFAVELPAPQFEALAAEHIGDMSESDAAFDSDLAALSTSYDSAIEAAQGLGRELDYDDAFALQNIEAAGNTLVLGTGNVAQEGDSTIDPAMAGFENPTLSLADIENPPPTDTRTPEEIAADEAAQQYADYYNALGG